MKEEKEAERDKGPLAEPKGEAKKKDCSRRRQRSRSRSRRSRTRRRSREKKDKKRGSPSPEKKKEVDKKPTSPPAEEDDGVEVATEEEEEAAPEEIKDDAEADKRYSLTRTAEAFSKKAFAPTAAYTIAFAAEVLRGRRKESPTLEGVQARPQRTVLLEPRRRPW